MGWRGFGEGMIQAEPMRDKSFVQHAEMFGEIHCHSDTFLFASNLDTDVELLRIDDALMPLTINRVKTCNSWICSPRTTYCDYAIEELHRHLHQFLSQPLSLICRSYGYVLERARIDQAVTVNNWLLSTNLYPALRTDLLDKLVEVILRRWPEHAVWFRSLNAEHNADWLHALETFGFMLIPSRQVYVYEDIPSKIARHVNLKRDMRLLRETPLRPINNSEFRCEDYARIAYLYRQLYLEKYSRLNPQYTAHFMQRWHAAGLLELKGFKDVDDVLQGVVGIFRQGDTITAPIVGYNTVLAQSLGLYRLLMASVFETAMLTGASVNLSAGAAEFKRLRGGKPVIEYSAVFAKHLCPSRQRVISMLHALTTSIAVPIMQRFEL
jgi:hypothetical protein